MSLLIWEIHVFGAGVRIGIWASHHHMEVKYTEYQKLQLANLQF